MKNDKKLIFGFIDREKPGTWIFAIIVAMLTVPLAVTLILYYNLNQKAIECWPYISYHIELFWNFNFIFFN